MKRTTWIAIVILLLAIPAVIWGSGIWGSFTPLPTPATSADAIVTTQDADPTKTSQLNFTGSADDLLSGTGWLTGIAAEIVANTLKVSFPEAPTDGQQYARQSNAWSVVTGGGEGTGNVVNGTVDGEHPIWSIASGAYLPIMPDFLTISTYMRSTFFQYPTANDVRLGIGALDDAPSDGNQYARQSGAWVVVTGGGGGGEISLVPPAYSDTVCAPGAQAWDVATHFDYRCESANDWNYRDAAGIWVDWDNPDPGGGVTPSHHFLFTAAGGTGSQVYDEITELWVGSGADTAIFTNVDGRDVVQASEDTHRLVLSGSNIAVTNSITIEVTHMVVVASASIYSMRLAGSGDVWYTTPSVSGQDRIQIKTNYGTLVVVNTSTGTVAGEWIVLRVLIDFENGLVSSYVNGVLQTHSEDASVLENWAGQASDMFIAYTTGGLQVNVDEIKIWKEQLVAP